MAQGGGSGAGRTTDGPLDEVDDAEFAAYAEEQWGTLVRSAVFLGCSLPDAEDVAQTTLVKAYRAWGRVSAARNRDAYVYRMLINCLRDTQRRPWWRRERSTDRLPDPGVDDGTSAVDTTDAVHRALGKLSKVNRDVVVLRYFAQLTEAQTAAALGVPPGTVKSRLSRALAQLSVDRQLAEVRAQPSARSADGVGRGGRVSPRSSEPAGTSDGRIETVRRKDEDDG